MSYNSRRNTIFVYNLDVNVSEADFLSYFRKRYYGSVKSGEIVQYSKKGKLFRYGIINFVDSASAKKAVRDKNYLNGEKIVCKYASIEWKDQNAHQKSEVPPHLRTIYVNSLNINVTSHHLIDYFQRFGPIVNARIVQGEDDISVGYGFVEFYCTSSVKEVQEKRPHRIHNQYIQTVRNYPKDVPTHLKKPSTILYVYNYDQNTNEKHIEKYFSQFGCITLVSRKETRPDNIKFMELQFDDYDAVDKICLMDNHKINNCHTIKVSKYLGDSIEKLVKAMANTETGTETQKITEPAAEFNSNTNQLESTENQSSSKSTPHRTERNSLSRSSANHSRSSRRHRSRTKKYKTKKLTNTKTETKTQKITKPAAELKSNRNQLKSTENQSSSKCTRYTRWDSMFRSSNNGSSSSRRGSRTETYKTEKQTNTKTGTETQKITKSAEDFNSSMNQLKSTENQPSSESTPHSTERNSLSRSPANDSPSSRHGSRTETYKTEKQTNIETGTETQKITKPDADFNTSTNQLKSTETYSSCNSTPRCTEWDSLSLNSDNDSPSSRPGSRSETPLLCSDNDSLCSRRGSRSEASLLCSDNDSAPSSRRGSRSETSLLFSDNDSPSSRRASTTETYNTKKLTFTKTGTETWTITKSATDFELNTNQLKSTENQSSSKCTHFTRWDSLFRSSNNGSSSSRRGSMTETYNTNNECELEYKGGYSEEDMVTKRLVYSTGESLNIKNGTEKQNTTKSDPNSKSDTVATFTFGEKSSALIQSFQSIASKKRKRSTSSDSRNPKSSKTATQLTAINFPSQDCTHQTNSWRECKTETSSDEG
ncbi:uncharacterized protein LOC135843170 [Planococcus citri]|uniref:uncharacterized protein LOC135843170 n=1 Tax=Planococcus citri TaxID=170843 RepID=UPI0031F83112